MLKNRETENAIMDYLTNVLGFETCELFEAFLKYFSCDDTVDFLVNFCNERDIDVNSINHINDDESDDDEE